MRYRAALLGLVLVLATSTAPATERGPKSRPKRPAAPPPVTIVDADPRASSASAARAGARSDSAADAAANVAADVASSSGGNAFTSSEATDVLALDLPGHAAATAVDGCHVSRGSLGAVGIGSGGRVKIDAECAAHARCLEHVATLERLGQRTLAVHAAARCAGIELPEGYALEHAPPSTSAPPAMAVRDPDGPYVTREEFERAWAELVAK